MEKDFWVCWLLGILFESEFADNLVFKGGTSLSKVFGVIDRFSEDIDLSLSPTFLKLPEAGATRNQANKWMTKAEVACEVAVRMQIMPALEAMVVNVLGKNERVRFEFLKDFNTNSPVLLFHYPSSQPTGFEYLKRSVKLEFGSLTDQQPIGYHTIRPWVAEVFLAAFPDWQCEVVVLAAINQHDLRNRVVLWKSQFFGSSWANYDLAKPGTFRLVPQAERLPALQRDYQSMRDMYLTKPVSFDDVLTILSDLEHQINQTGA